DGIVAGTGLDQHAVLTIAQRGGAARIGANEIAGDQVLASPRAIDLHSVIRVARDDVPLETIGDAVAIGPDLVALGAAGDPYTRSTADAHACRAGCISAGEVAGDLA